MTVRIFGKRRHWSGLNASAELHNPAHDLIRAFENDQFRAASQTDYSVGSGFDMLDQIGVQNQWYVIDASDWNHGEEAN